MTKTNTHTHTWTPNFRIKCQCLQICYYFYLVIESLQVQLGATNWQPEQLKFSMQRMGTISMNGVWFLLKLTRRKKLYRLCWDSSIISSAHLINWFKEFWFLNYKQFHLIFNPNSEQAGPFFKRTSCKNKQTKKNSNHCTATKLTDCFHAQLNVQLFY